MKKFLSLFFLFACIFSTQLFADVPIFFGEEIIVTAARKLQPISKTFQKSQIITADDLKKSGVKTVAEALNNLASIKVKSSGSLGGVSSIRIKSATASQVLVLLDGQKINSTLLGMFDLNDIPVSNISRIEIVEDALSSIYGADALGGVINIITINKPEKSISATVGYGSFNTIDWNISVGTEISNLHLSASFQQLKSDGFRQNSDYKNTSATFNIDLGDKLNIKYTQINSERGNPGVPPSDNDKWLASNPFDRQKDFYGNLNIDLKHRYYGLIDKISIFDIVQNQHVHYLDTFTYTFVDDRYFSRIYGISAQKDINFANSTLMYGAEVKRSIGSSSKAGDHNIENSSVFANIQTNTDLPLAANYAVRYDYNQVWGSQLIPAVSLLTNLGHLGSVKYSISNAFRAPTINELYWNEPSWGMFGNPNLKPEKSTSFGVYYSNLLFGTNLNIGYYKNNISDMISWVETAPWIWQTMNISKAKIEGINLTLKKELLKGISLYLDYNKEESIDLTSDKYIPYSPTYKLNAGLELKNKDFAVNLRSRDISSVYTNTANTKSIPAYRVVDLILNKKISDFSISASIMNIFDETYYESVGFSSVDWQERGYPMPGRRFEIKVSY